jgi:serine carboxypeptidase-like clade II
MKTSNTELCVIFTILLFIIGGVISTLEGDKIRSLPDQPIVHFQQFSGHITIDETHQRALFYYFVEAEVDPASKPLVLWLNGGT